jgi:hypothetical protein
VMTIVSERPFRRPHGRIVLNDPALGIRSTVAPGIASIASRR